MLYHFYEPPIFRRAELNSNKVESLNGQTAVLTSDGGSEQVLFGIVWTEYAIGTRLGQRREPVPPEHTLGIAGSLLSSKDFSDTQNTSLELRDGRVFKVKFLNSLHFSGDIVLPNPEL